MSGGRGLAAIFAFFGHAQFDTMSASVMSDAKIEIVEAAYESFVDSSEWLRGLGQLLRKASPDVATCFAFELERVEGRIRLGNRWTEDPTIADQIDRTFCEAPPELLDLFYGTPLVARTSREVLADAAITLESTLLAEIYGNSGFIDTFGISAFGPYGRGVVMGMGLRDGVGPPKHEIVNWTHVAAHIAAGARLHENLGERLAIDQADAIFSPEGRLEHLADPETNVDALRQGVDGIERARSRRHSTEEALELWKGLIAGEWSLVEHFESGGRRYYAAVRNPADRAKGKPQGLTRREAEVIAYIATGTSTKATAYALGIDEVTVRGYLGGAMTKLGVRSRTELISLRAMLLDASVGDSDDGTG
jgi:DNA-binding CsgD family transcriptional regulator